MKKYILHSPIVFEGKEITEVTLDFDALDGKAISLANKAARRFFGPEADDVDANMALTAIAAGLPLEAVASMKARDTMELIGATVDFFSQSASQASPEQES